MGYEVIDQYSLCHFATGVLAYFWSIPLMIWLAIHILFEYVENTHIGMKFINTYFKCWWPGGKTHADNMINRTSDVLFGGIGWIISYYLDQLYQ